MSNKKSIYRTPDARIVEMELTLALLTASSKADISGVEEDELDFLF